MKKNSNNISSLKLCTFWHITEFSMKRNWIFPSIYCFSKLLLNHDLQKRKLRLLTIGWEMQWSCNYMYWLYIYIYMLQVDILWDLYSRSVGTDGKAMGALIHFINGKHFFLFLWCLWWCFLRNVDCLIMEKENLI